MASGVSSTTDSVQAESNEPYTEATLETLAGTWTGEALVDKVIILRGGNGFVIFKNGASMNYGRAKGTLQCLFPPGNQQGACLKNSYGRGTDQMDPYHNECGFNEGNKINSG